MRCVCCMREIEDGLPVCNFCNFPQDTPPEYPDALAPGTELRNRFLLGKELGRGGFGITYIGYDKYLDCKVAVKEYYPQTLAARLPGEVKLFWRNSQLRDAGCQNVIREAQKMHRIGILPAAVHVLDVFYENNTAYIAMDYVEGITLKKFLLNNGVLSAKKCMEMMMPILDTMIQMHEAGVIHRDLSPDNIMIQPDLKPRILDLGAAKDIQMESGNTILVARNGFSPMEQYQTNGDVGTWTDVYALCATIYYTLTGRVPPAAMDRNRNDDDLPFNSGWKIPEKLCQVLQDGMRMQVENRIPNMTELKRRLLDSMASEGVRIPEETGNSELPNSPIPTNLPRISEEPVVEWKKEKSKALLPALLTMFGKKRKSKSWRASNKAERKPVMLTISQPDSYPAYISSGTGNCLDDMDEEETVLIDIERPALAKGVLVQDSTGKRIEISKCCFVLGRLTNAAVGSRQLLADCTIEDSTKHISRRHAAILFDGEAFYLQDISGKNSTLLNSVRIQNCTIPEKGNVFPSAYRLYDGDCIQLADEKLTFHTGGGL